MKIKKIFILATLCYSVSGMAAFNDNESKQLSEIDMKSESIVTDIVKKLDKAVSVQVSNNPEKKEQILALRVAWDVTTQKKCQLETFESKGTDSEISTTNSCLLKGYQMEIDYFNNMLP
ncbi:hypothetical protein [Ewingella americana]|uniref:DUF1311 domain-containing protein n=1 Tax=Ewingella americana TaxID=41202 RepID=A0A502G0X0_9GAMM|nr:hypothetical protein [Ewingella americana]TPG55419.1 hypothetical protein EAH77_23655 [Ewingella americana]